MLEILSFLSSVNLAVKDQHDYFKIRRLLSLLGPLKNQIKFLMNFVYFLEEITRNSDCGVLKTFDGGPPELFVLLDAEIRNSWSRFER